MYYNHHFGIINKKYLIHNNNQWNIVQKNNKNLIWDSLTMNKKITLTCGKKYTFDVQCNNKLLSWIKYW